MTMAQSAPRGEALENGYQGKPYPSTHPDRLATLARLHGLRAAAPERCRVLELGCGDGANLLPMAEELPDSEFVGIDLNRKRVAAGAAWARQLDLTNIRLEAGDLAELRDEYGKFDYVIAHGVYSWVPPAVRERLLPVCRELLTPEGIAFVSFNTLPGWNFLRSLREFAQLVRQTSGDLTAEQLFKRVRALANLFAVEQPSDDAQGAHLRQLLRRLETTSDYLMAFNYLSEESEPVALTAFNAHATASGLRYVCDANHFEQSWRSVPPRARGAVTQLTNDPLEREAFADHFTARIFRRALLCHADAPAPSFQLSAVRELQVLGTPKYEAASPAELLNNRPVSFTTPSGGRLSTALPLVKLSLDAVARSWPCSISFADLAKTTCERFVGVRWETVGDALQGALGELYAAGAVDLRTNAPRCVRAPGERPLTSAFARAQVKRGDMVTNQHHDFTRLRDELSRTLFSLLDGTRGRQQLLELTCPLADAGALDAPLIGASDSELGRQIELRLTSWGRHALLLG